MGNKVKDPMLRRLMANDSYVFLMKELEKVDEKILEPLTGTDWPRDMPVKTGGGFMENISALDVTYASSGAEDDNILLGAANDIPVMQADMSKQTAKMITFCEYMAISELEEEKMISIGRDPETFLNKGIRLHFDKFVDKNVYIGHTKSANTGLCNNPAITRSSAATGAGGTTLWRDKTADEILKDINTVISAVWAENDCASDALPDHILVPVEQFGQLVTRKVSDDSERSILTYVLENNICTRQGRQLVICPCKWCTGIGSSSSDRMVAYMNQVDRICFNMTVPLRRMDVETGQLMFKIPYVGQISEVRFLYPTTVRYMDGI